MADGLEWQARPAATVETFFELKARRGSARATHAKFLAAFGLESAQFPLLALDPQDWRRPFSTAPG